MIGHLGTPAYGLIPLATTASSYLILFTTALNSATARFMTMALDRGDDDEASQIFNTSFWGTVGILALLLIPCVWVALHGNWFFQVPKGLKNEFVLLLLAMFGVFCGTTLSSAFGISAFSRNRLYLSNAVSILNTGVRVTIIVCLFSFFHPKVSHIGWAMLVATGVAGMGYILVCHYLTPQLKLSLSAFSITALRKMTGMGIWIVINAVGALLYLSIDLIVINKLLGPEATGQYGAVMIWSAQLRSFAGVITGVFAPTVMVLYSRDDVIGLVKYACRSVKFSGLLLAVPIGLICGLAKPLLRVWLGESFVPMAPLMSLMTFHLCVNLAILPLFNIQVATNNVRLPGIVTCVMGLINLVLAVILAGTLGWGMYGVVIAGAVMLTAKNLIFTPLYGARILGLKWNTFYSGIMLVVGMTALLVVLGWGLTAWFSIITWKGLAASGIAMSAVYGVIVFAFILSQDERLQLKRLLTAWTYR